MAQSQPQNPIGTSQGSVVGDRICGGKAHERKPRDRRSWLSDSIRVLSPDWSWVLFGVSEKKAESRSLIPTILF